MAKLDVSNSTIKGSAVQSLPGPGDDPQGPSNEKNAGFQRRPGRMARLREGWARLKEKFDRGHAQSRLTRALERLPANHQTRAASDIRQRGQAHISLATSGTHIDKQQDIARHRRLLTALRDTPSSGFQMLSPEAKIQVLSALDVCAGLSDKSSLEGLLMLKECIDALRLAQSGAAPDPHAFRGKLARDFSDLDAECMRQIGQFGS